MFSYSFADEEEDEESSSCDGEPNYIMQPRQQVAPTRIHVAEATVGTLQSSIPCYVSVVASNVTMPQIINAKTVNMRTVNVFSSDITTNVQLQLKYSIRKERTWGTEINQLLEEGEKGTIRLSVKNWTKANSIKFVVCCFSLLFVCLC